MQCLAHDIVLEWQIKVFNLFCGMQFLLKHTSFLLRKLKSFDVSQHILQLVYRSLIESVLSFNIITWYGNVSGKN